MAKQAEVALECEAACSARFHSEEEIHSRSFGVMPCTVGQHLDKHLRKMLIRRHVNEIENQRVQ